MANDFTEAFSGTLNTLMPLILAQKQQQEGTKDRAIREKYMDAITNQMDESLKEKKKRADILDKLADQIALVKGDDSPEAQEIRTIANREKEVAASTGIEAFGQYKRLSEDPTLEKETDISKIMFGIPQLKKIGTRAKELFTGVKQPTYESIKDIASQKVAASRGAQTRGKVAEAKLAGLTQSDKARQIAQLQKLAMLKSGTFGGQFPTGRQGVPENISQELFIKSLFQ